MTTRVVLPSSGRHLKKASSVSVLSSPLVGLGFVLGYLPRQVQQYLLPASLLGQATMD